MKIQKYKHKSHFCIFCKMEIKRIYEHFNRKHKKEDKVRQITATQDKKLRYWMWKQLTQQGDHYFNTQSDISGGRLRLVKTPPSQFTKKKYFNCSHCLGRIRNTSRAQHLIRCRKLLLESAEIIKTEKDVFHGVPEHLVNRIRNSTYLTNFINHMKKFKGKQIIRSYITDICSMEEELQNYTGMPKPLTMYLQPNTAEKIVIVIKRLSGEEKLGTEIVMKYPFKAKRLCQLIETLANFLILYFSKTNMDMDMLNTTKFLNIFKNESLTLIRKYACHSIKIKKLRNPNRLPKTSDIQKLIHNLNNEASLLLKELELSRNSSTWRRLSENTLLRLTIYNRRRGGALEKLTVEDFNRREIKTKVATEEALFGLDKEDEEFLSNLRIIEIIHKHENVVPILVTKELNTTIEKLLQYRELGKVNKENPYVFAAGRNSLNFIKCNKVMEKYRKDFPVGIRELFTATNLRKHGATTAQVLDLSPQDKQEWAYHMGHTLAVHDKYYRNPEQVNSVLKTGRILNALNEGTLKYYKGKKIKDISFSKPKVKQKIQEIASTSEKDFS